MGEKLPDTAGYFVRLTDEEDRLLVEGREYVPEKDKQRAAEKKRKVMLQKELKSYLLGKGERPAFLPTKKD